MKPEIRDLLISKQAEILSQWYASIIELYPQDTQGFWQKREHKFSQPIPYTFAHGIETIFTELTQEIINEESLIGALDSIIRIRAIQNLPASQAVNILLPLKNELRKICWSQINRSKFERTKQELALELDPQVIFNEFTALEDLLEELMLKSFDIYMSYREKVFELRVKEYQNLALLRSSE